MVTQTQVQEFFRSEMGRLLRASLEDLSAMYTEACLTNSAEADLYRSQGAALLLRKLIGSGETSLQLLMIHNANLAAEGVNRAFD